MVDVSATAIVDTLAGRLVTKTRNASGPPPKPLVWSRQLGNQVQKSKLVKCRLRSDEEANTMICQQYLIKILRAHCRLRNYCHSRETCQSFWERVYHKQFILLWRVRPPTSALSRYRKALPDLDSLQAFEHSEDRH